MKRAMVAATLLAGTAMGESVVDLAGAWRFQRDDATAGVQEAWHERPLAGGQTIRLPGTMDEGKLGQENPRPPDLSDLYRPNVYEGAAWYERDIEIPEAWRGKRVTLFLERCRWVTQVWLDGKPCGDRQDSLVTPHEHVLGIVADRDGETPPRQDGPGSGRLQEGRLQPGKHRLTIRNDNTKWIDLGRFVSALYGGTPGNLNGIVGRIELRATPQVWIEDVQVYPDAAAKTARLNVRVGNATGEAGEGRCQVSGVRCQGEKVQASVTWGPEGGAVVLDVPLKPDTPVWDEFNPSLVTIDLDLTPDTRHLTPDACSLTFGLRDFAADGTQFTVNGRPVFLRGTLECQVFPLTGYPPCDVLSWQRIYRIIKSYGLNHMRFHSWCPPEAAFAAADIEGVYLQAEAPRANVGVGSEPRRDAFTEAELLRIVRAYGNHPSFCMMTLGNEYGGKDEVLSRWVQMLIDEDPRHLYSSASAAQTTGNRQFTVSPAGRGVHGAKTDHDLRDIVGRQDHSLVGHEIGQWTFLPDFDEMRKYTGVMEPRNFEIVRDDLQKRGMLDQAKDFFRATGAQAVLLYKEEIELLLRTPGYAGYQLLDLHDYPSQGTALVGPLDPFWDSKGFISPEVFRRFSGPTVPLLRMPKRTYTVAETFTGAVEVAHFGPSGLKSVRTKWTIDDAPASSVVANELPPRDVPAGRLTALGSFTASLAAVRAPTRLTVRIALDGTEFANEWEIWVYPEEPAPTPPSGIVVARQWDDAAKGALAAGERVLLLPSKRNLRRSLPGRFLPVFWSPVWFPSQKPNTMGILCDPKHPLFAQFPTEFHSNWQWWDLVNHSSSIILDDAPPDFRPTVQVIDNFARNHKLGSVFEANVGPGRLLVCAIDAEKDLVNRPAARQFAKSLYGYAASDAFKPRQALDVATLDALFGRSTAGLAARLGATASADSQNADYPAANAIDGDPDTLWHSEWEPASSPLPHRLTVDLEKPMPIAGIRYLPRQDMANGRIAEYAVYVSTDGATWGEPVASGRWPDGTKEQVVRFASPVEARWVRLESREEVHGNPWAGVAELEVLQP